MSGRRGPGGALSCAGLLVALSWVTQADAQAWVSDVQLGVASGLEGADTGAGVGWQRARTRLVLGVDVGNDEAAFESYGARAFVELERSVTVGAEVGYARWLSDDLSVFFGGVVVLTPRRLFGGTVALSYFLPLGSRLSVPVWASLSALPLGNDRSGPGAVVWTLLGTGVRSRF